MLLTSEGCNTFSMAKTPGKAQCAPYYKNTITYSTSVYYYYKSLPSKSLTIAFMWRLPIPRDAPWRISILISIIIMMLLLLLLLFLLLLLLLFLLLLLLLLLLQLLLLLLLLLLVVVERINYSVIHIDVRNVNTNWPRDTNADWSWSTCADWFRDMDAHAGRPRDAYTG